MPKLHPYAYLYVFRSRSRGVKIGVACEHTLRRRLNNCQTWTGELHKPFSRIYHLPDTAYAVEKRVKRRLAEIDPTHYGEWFKVSLGVALSAIEEDERFKVATGTVYKYFPRTVLQQLRAK